MANYERFTEQEIPYGILAKFGLTNEMIDDLPHIVQQRFLSGRTTPVLPIVTVNPDGDKVQSLAKISLVRLNDGTVDICFVPVWDDEDLTEFTPEQQEKLKRGLVTTAYRPNKGYYYIQFDDTISQVMAVPIEIINQNIFILTQNFGLTDDDKSKLQNGDVVEMKVDEQTVSAGVDLNEMTGLRIADGDAMAWQQDANADKLPKYNFGIYGCWIADDDNVLSYVADKDYTQEILDEQKRVESRNAAEAQMRMAGQVKI